ncbi:MAG: helix-turn-helix domain-containing protein [bacterium]
MKIRNEYTCPLELVQDMTKGKWKYIIMWRLHHGRSSLSKLEKTIEGITQKMLLEHLRDLIEFDFVYKKTFDGYPLRVEYYLTEHRGKKFIEALGIMQNIGVDYMKENGMQDNLDKIKERKLYYDEILAKDNIS